MKNSKIGRMRSDPVASKEPSEHVVIFGSQRIGAIYALRNNLDPRSIRLATGGAEMARLLSGPITVVRVSEEAWRPSTHPCELRTKETEQALKRLEQEGAEITTVRMD